MGRNGAGQYRERVLRRTAAALVLLAALPLAGCSTATAKGSASAAAASASSAHTVATATPTPTPTARLLTIPEARKRYLDIACPSNGFAIEQGRANANLSTEVAPIVGMAAKARPVDIKMLESFTDPTVRWPVSPQLVADEVTLMNTTVANDKQVADALSMDQLNQVIQSQNEQSLPAPGKALRKALGLDPELVVACNGYATAASPAGYPKVVSVKSLPSDVASYYEDEKRIPVALGPGVWTTLDPGTTVTDAVISGQLEGYCTSIKVFERKYVFSAQIAGGCW